MINDIPLFCVSLITIKDETMFIFISYVIKTLKKFIIDMQELCAIRGFKYCLVCYKYFSQFSFVF